MNAAEVLTEAFARVPEVARAAVTGLEPQTLAVRPDSKANSIAWLVWHLARGQDVQVAQVAGEAEVWLAQGWHERSGLPFGPGETGYGHGPEDVTAVGEAGLTADFLTGYLDAVHESSTAYLQGLTDADLDRVVDESWDPPVTLGVRLVSVVDDCVQHAGQAAYVRGLLDRT